MQALSNPNKPVRVLATGVFDLLHIGHINFLEYAKAQGDYLIVGVASDLCCQRNKQTLPTIPEAQRLRVIKSLKMVDEVMLSKAAMIDTELALDWIASLQPHRVVTSIEWQGSSRWTALEAELTLKGVQVIYAPRTEGISSTEIKCRITNY